MKMCLRCFQMKENADFGVKKNGKAKKWCDTCCEAESARLLSAPRCANCGNPRKETEVLCGACERDKITSLMTREEIPAEVKGARALKKELKKRAKDDEEFSARALEMTKKLIRKWEGLGDENL